MQNRFKKTSKQLITLSLAAMLTFSAAPAFTTQAASKNVYRVSSLGELTQYDGDANVTIRSNTSSIAVDAFEDVTTKRFTVQSGNPYYKSINGVLYNKSGTLLVKVPTEYTGTLHIPSSVTSICAYAFEDCDDITRITMPSSVKSIGTGTFKNCASLRSISLSSQLKKIPDSTFSGCEQLAGIKLPSKITQIGDSAFYSCRSLSSVSIPGNVDKLGERVFEGCSSLKNVTYSKKLDSIPQSTFDQCSSLTSITNIGNVEDIHSYAFNMCSSLSITLPKKLSSISTKAFYGCNALGTIKIPRNVEIIDNSSFSAAASGFEVSKANKYYSSKNGLLLNKKGTALIQVPAKTDKTLTIPNGVTSIYPNALRYSNPVKVIFPDSITSLDKYFFSDMTALKHIVLPETLNSFAHSYVSPENLGSDHIQSIRISQKNPNYSSENGYLYNKEKTSLIFAPIAKKGSITLPDNLAKLNGQLKINNLSNISVTKDNEHFTSVDGVLYDNRTRTLRSYPLKKTSYAIPKTVKDISYLYKIQGVNNIKSITVARNSKSFYSKNGVLFENDDTLAYYPPMKKGAYVIPDTTRYIHRLAFRYADKLTSLTITKNVKRYNSRPYNLNGCGNLKEVIVKQGNLTSISINFGDIYDDDTFKKLVLPSGITSLSLYNLPETAAIYGWSNTKAQSVAKNIGCKFVSLGTVPGQVSGLRMHKIVNKLQLTWNPCSYASGYQVYTDYDTIAEIKGSQNTKCNIKDKYSSDTIYVRAYIVKNNKRIYGKAKKFSY